MEITGTVTQRSNGTIEMTTSGAADKIVVHESALSSKQLPNLGDNVTVRIDVTESAAEIEARHAPEIAQLGIRVDGDGRVSEADTTLTTTASERRKKP